MNGSKAKAIRAMVDNANNHADEVSYTQTNIKTPTGQVKSIIELADTCKRYLYQKAKSDYKQMASA